MEIPLPDLTIRKKATIKYLDGGFGFLRKVDILGIRIGKKIEILSSQPLGGPVVIKVDNMQIAIGRGMANKIIVETE